jgi:L-lactate dehydrogenase complex protein LldF
MSESPILHRDTIDNDAPEGVTRGGKRLDHAEGTSTPIRSKVPEPEPRGARIRGNRPVDQSEAADRFIAAREHEKMHDEWLWDLRRKRDREMHGIPEWKELRNLASAIKEHTLTHLDGYLDQFETNARANGVHVHWVRDAGEHNRTVLDVLQSHGAKRLIKSKSMLTEECDFRGFMTEHGVEIIETDLGDLTTKRRATWLFRQSTSCVRMSPGSSLRSLGRIQTRRTCTTWPKHRGKPLGL